MTLQITVVPVGMLEVNCYLIWPKEKKETLIVDPGEEPERIADAISKRGLVPVAILLTHGHVDHIRAVPELCRRYSIPVYLQAAELPLYKSPENALPPWLNAAENLPLPLAEPPQMTDFEYVVLNTPGHTPGGVCYFFPKDRYLFSGDTLFHGSIGRTDLPGGNMGVLLTSIRQKLLQLPAEVQVFPGHGDPTTIGQEINSNPYLISDKC